MLPSGNYYGKSIAMYCREMELYIVQPTGTERDMMGRHNDPGDHYLLKIHIDLWREACNGEAKHHRVEVWAKDKGNYE